LGVNKDMRFEIDAIEINNELIGRIYADQELQGIDGYAYGKNWEEDIPVGTVFHQILKVRRNETEILFQSIHLELTEVNYFNKDTDIVPHGHTARILLKGIELELLSGELKKIDKHSALVLNA